MNGLLVFGPKKLAVGLGAILLLAVSLFTVGAVASAQSNNDGDTLTIDFEAPGVANPFVDVLCADFRDPQSPVFAERGVVDVSQTGEAINFTVDQPVLDGTCFVNYPSPDVAVCTTRVDGLGTVEVLGEDRELFELFADAQVATARIVNAETGEIEEQVVPHLVELAYPAGFDVVREGVVTIRCVDSDFEPADPGIVPVDDFAPVDLESADPGSVPVDDFAPVDLEPADAGIVAVDDFAPVDLEPADAGIVAVVEPDSTPVDLDPAPDPAPADSDPQPISPLVCSLSGGSIISFIEDSLGFDPFIGEENFPTRLNAQGDSPGLAGVLEFEIAIDLPAGDYSLFGESVDTHSGRASALNPVQPSEQWFAEFLAADGSVLATSGTTGDIPDLVRFGEWSGPIGDISLSENAVSIRVLHATPGTPTQNSFQPVCLSAVADASFVEVIPEQIEEEEEAPDEFVEAPTPVEPAVLGVAPVAQSQPGNPTFTG